MFNPQNYEKMKTETAKRIKSFIKEIELNPLEEYNVSIYDEKMIILLDKNMIHIYIINGKAYQEQVTIYPIFSMNEIKEALTQF